MSYYCPHCTTIHSDKELCTHYRNKLRHDPNLISEAANFANIAGQNELVSGQSLNSFAQEINKLIGTNLSFEGSHQLARDVQVFRQLNVDSYCKSGVFSNAKNASTYMKNASDGQLSTLTKKLNGTAQEIDWERLRNGKLTALWEKSNLLGEEVTNAAGVDGITINRFTGSQISRTTIKATQDVHKGLGTNIRDVIQALENGTLDPSDNVAGVRGTDSAVKKAIEKNLIKAKEEGNEKLIKIFEKARQNLTVEEIGSDVKVQASTERLKGKIINCQASAVITSDEMIKKAANGAVIGAVIGLAVGAVVSYLAYKEGLISQEQALNNVSQATVKGAMTGGILSAATLFLPAGGLGFIAGIAVGIYFNKALTNILDEVYGEGTYIAILDSSGFVFGAAMSLENALKKIKNDQIQIEKTIISSRISQAKIVKSFNEFDLLMGKIL